MATLTIKSLFPADEQEGVPLKINPSVTLSGLDYDEDSLKEGFFLEGPDTDQFVGPGQIDLISPHNISQGEIDDFFRSPGYQGIVQGTVTVSGIAGDMVVTFVPTLPLAPLIEYKMNLTGVEDLEGNSIEGLFTSSFITGSGSIVEVPSDTSSSVLSATITEAGSQSISSALEVVRSTPIDHSINNQTDLEEIVIEFNKPIDPSSISGNIEIQAIPVTDHPNASVHPQRDLAFTTEVDGNKLKIKI